MSDSVLRRAGVLDALLKEAWDIESMAWRRADGDLLASMEVSAAKGPDPFLCYPVHKLSNYLLEQLLQRPESSVLMKHAAIAVGQDEEKAWIDVQVGDQRKRIEGDFVIGGDGANSTVRKSLFGNTFPGHTWPQQIVVTNVSWLVRHTVVGVAHSDQVRYDIKKHGWSDCQWIVDPDSWGVVAGLSKPEGLWRVAYNEEMGFTHEELRVRLSSRFETFLPGNPKPADYEVVRFSPFVMQQRCVERMRVGRICLMGDAAHLCNPM